MKNWNLQINNIRYENTSNFIAPKKQFFSQYNQDRTLENCIFKGHKNGIFMDIGAHDGVDLNNTLYFENNNNWTGINVEPLKIVYDRLVTNRKNNININCAISDTDGVAQFISNSGYTEMLSGLLSEYDTRHIDRINNENKMYNSHSDIIMINTNRIETICDNYDISHINYLSIDVEGGESKVINSINFNKLFIDIIGFENNYQDVSTDIINNLMNKDYIKLPNHIADIFMIHKNSVFIKNIKY